MKKILFVFVLLSFMAFNLYSISLDELIDSYDFNYDSGDVEISLENYSISNETLFFNFSLHGFQDDYLLDFKIISTNTKTFKSKSIVLDLNTSYMYFLVNESLKDLETGEYELILFLERYNDVIYRNYSFLGFDLISNYTFEELDVIEEDSLLLDISYETIDLNSNSLIDYFLFEIELNLDLAGEYEIRSLFMNYLGERVILKQDYLDIDSNKFNINLSSLDVLTLRKSGPYFLKSVMIRNDSMILDSKVYDLQIEDYSYYDFENSNLVDLVFRNVSYNETSGEFNFSILNLGLSDSSYFYVNFFDSNLNHSERFVAPYLLSNESLNFSYNLSSNLSEIYLFVDSYDNIYELNESNNEYVYPPIVQYVKQEVNETIVVSSKSSGSSSGSSGGSSFVNVVVNESLEYEDVINISDLVGNTSNETLVKEVFDVVEKSNLTDASLNDFEVVLRPDEKYSDKISGNFLENNSFSLIGFGVGTVFIGVLVWFLML